MPSSRVKRLLRKIETIRGTGNKKRRISGSDEDCSRGSTKLWTPKSLGDLPVANIYNSTSRSPPAELFRKDLISAMKLPDSEPLSLEEYWLISDQWKQEWERGVQVPVNPEGLPEPSVRVTRKKEKSSDFKLPKRLIRITHDDFYTADYHQLSTAPALAEKICRYDIDDCDLHWLTAVNKTRQDAGVKPIEESIMEIVMEELETRCYENMQEAIHAEAGLGIEFDEDVICDVCRSPDSEEGNEMVFCDACDICVHQACYGITEIPAGSWLCRTCSLGRKPNCILCPNRGGAMKSTRNGQKWAHVSCALWIPEVSIGCVETMEPITKIGHIPQSRWALICCLCRDRIGACIQCSVKSCKTAYHVTCGFQNGLDMKAVVEDENVEDGVKLRSFCPKHSKNKNRSGLSDSEGEDSTNPSSLKLSPSAEEKAGSRMKKLQEIESVFYNYVKPHAISTNLRIDADVVDFIYQYWKIKRRTGFNKPLLIPRSGENDVLGQEQEDTLYARMKMFVRVRQDLERVRNLCYMVSRREKLSRSWCTMREQIFQKQVAALADTTSKMTDADRHSIIHSCHGQNIYDRLYAHNSNCCVGEDSSGSRLPLTNAESQQDAESNGSGNRKQKGFAERLPNPYAKTYLNGVGFRSHGRRSNGQVEKGEKSDDEASKGPSNPEDGEVTSVGNDRLNDGDAGESDVKSREVHEVSTDVAARERQNSIGHGSGSAKPTSELSMSLRSVGLSEVAKGDEVDRVSATLGALTTLQEPDVAVVQNSQGCTEHALRQQQPRVRSRSSYSSSKQPRRIELISVEEATKDPSVRDSSVKENVERLIGDEEVQATKPENKSEEEKSEQGPRNRKVAQRLRQQVAAKSSPEKLSVKDKNKRNSSAADRDKLRQESAKLHESLFSNNMKGSLAGYRIPKKAAKSESEGETRLEDEPQQQTQQTPPSQPPPTPTSPQVPVSPVKSFTTPESPSAQTSQQSVPPPWNNCTSAAAAASTSITAPPTSHSGACSSPLLPTPIRPAGLLATPPPDRRLTRRDRHVMDNNMPLTPPPPRPLPLPLPPPPLPLPPPAQMNGRDYGCSPRLVIKLRKDPNYPESSRWRRDSDIADPHAYNDFKCEQNKAAPKHSIRLKLNSFDRQPRYDEHFRHRQHHQPQQYNNGNTRHHHHHHNPAPPHSSNELHPPNRRNSSYPMRTRMNIDNSAMQGGNYSNYS